MVNKAKSAPRTHDVTGRPIARCQCGKCVYADGKCYDCYQQRMAERRPVMASDTPGQAPDLRLAKRIEQIEGISLHPSTVLAITEAFACYGAPGQASAAIPPALRKALEEQISGLKAENNILRLERDQLQERNDRQYQTIIDLRASIGREERER